MKAWFRKKRWLLGAMASLLLLALLAFGGLFVIGRFNLFHAHEHCIKGLGLAFRMYAVDHDGRYPFHTSGFGDALLLLVKDGQLPDPGGITAPGDDGAVFNECLQKGTDVPEERCSRVYIQGLSESNAYDNVVIAFDRYPTRGGDHFRRPWGPPMRDVVLSDGSVQFLHEKRWPAFAREQIELLVKLGFKRSELEKLFEVRTVTN